MKRESEKGLLSLEACIAVIIFLFLMLYLYSFFIVFEARNEMAHVLLASTDSMSLDAYRHESVEKSGNLTQLFSAIYHAAASPDESFVNTTYGYSDTGVNDAGLTELIKKRFVAYLADGSTSEADKILGRYHVVGGVSGLDFSKSHISGGNLYVTVEYTLEYTFRTYGQGKVKMSQSCCSKIWQ